MYLKRQFKKINHDISERLSSASLSLVAAAAATSVHGEDAACMKRLNNVPLLFINISTAFTGVRCTADEVLRLVGQMGLMNHWTRVVIVSSLNVIGSRWTTRSAFDHRVRTSTAIRTLAAR